MIRSSFWAATAVAMIVSTSALACPGGMGMSGNQGGGHDMHSMMHGQDMGHGQQMGQGCGQGGYCPMSGMTQADENRPTPSAQPNDKHAGHEPAAKKEETLQK